MTTPSPTQRFFGALLMGVGGLIAVLCGGCGSLFVIGGILSLFSSNAQDGPMLAGMGLVVGGVPAAIGVGLFLAGRAMRRPDPANFKVDKSVFDADPPT
jgi:hypothetical protein